MNDKLKVFSSKQADFMVVVAKRLVPDIGQLPRERQLDVIRVVDGALSEREPALQVQFGAFLKILNLAPFPRHFKTLKGLPPAIQDKWLRKFENSSIQKFRTGFWGLRTLIFMGYYGDPARAKEFNYTPSFKGNERLHD